MLDNGGGNIKLEQTEFVDMGPLSRYYSFKRDAHTGKKKKYKVQSSKHLPKDGWMDVQYPLI